MRACYASKNSEPFTSEILLKIKSQNAKLQAELSSLDSLRQVSILGAGYTGID